MIPAAFEYMRPRTIPEAIDLLRQHGDDAIATGMVMGKPVAEAYQLTKRNVSDALGGIASDAIRNAIDDWRSQTGSPRGGFTRKVKDDSSGI